MATLDDIDTKSAVRKFLERRTVVDREDASADSADEVAAVLESVAQAFLIHPQAALSFVIKAKNTLQQILTTDIEFVDFLTTSLRDIDSPSDPVSDLSDIVEAQTALVEVDRAGRLSDDLQSFGRYRDAIDRFLDQQLSKTLKRRRRKEFERTGKEARQDLFRALLAFGPIHALMAEKLKILQGSVADFRSVDLTKLVSSRAISRVRASLKKVSSGLQKQTLSKTSAAIELLAGRDALRSISNARDIYDPTIETGQFPPNRDIRVASHRAQAIATGTNTATDLTALSTPWTFTVTVDPLILGGTAYNLDLPFTGAGGSPYVKAAQGAPTYNIVAGHEVLYVAFKGITPPAYTDVMVRAVTLPTGGAVTVSAILTALNNGVTGLINGTAVELGAGRILIYGGVGVTGISILSSYPGTFDGITGIYTAANESVHAVLGFTDGQESGDPNVFSPAELVDLVKDRVTGATFSVVDGSIRAVSASTDLLSSLSFDDVALQFGFNANYSALPEYLELTENGEAVDPADLEVFVGSIVQASDISASSSRNLLSSVVSIEGTHLLFDVSALPRCDGAPVRIDAPIVGTLRTLLNNIKPYVGSFAEDSQNFQRALSPVLSKPTLAQVNDATKALTSVRDRLQNLLDLLQGAMVRDDQTAFGPVAAKIGASLQERGLDRSLDLLQSGQFSAFFAVDSQSASTSSNLMKSIEEVGRNDFPSTTIEENIPDLEPKAVTPDDDVLPGEELTESEEQI